MGDPYANRAKSPSGKGSHVKAGLHYMGQKRHELDAIPLPTHPALRRAKTDTETLPFHKKSISLEMESLIQNQKRSNRTSRRDSQLFDMLRDDSSSLSPSLVNSSISPLKALQDMWVQQNKAKEMTPKISAREAPLIGHNQASDDPLCRALREVSIKSRPPSWTIKLARLGDQDAKQTSKKQVNLAEAELRVYASENEPGVTSVGSSLVTPKQKRQRSNTQRVSLVMPMKALDVEELRDIARQKSTAESALIDANTHRGMGDPQVQIAKPKPVRPGKRPPSAAIFDPKTAISNYSNDSNLADSRPAVTHSSSLPNVLNAIASSSTIPCLSTNTRQPTHAEEYDPVTPTMNPSKRRSQIDPHRLSNITNPPILLQPTSRTRSSPFSFERTPSFVYRTQIVSLGDTSIDEEPGLSSSPPPESMHTTPKSENLTPLDEYRHLFDRFPPPLGTSPALPAIPFPQPQRDPAVSKSHQISDPVSSPSPRPAARLLPGHPKSLPSALARKARKQPKARARKRRSRPRSGSPLRNVLTPSFEWHPPNVADDVWTTKPHDSTQRGSSEVGSPLTDSTSHRPAGDPPRTLRLVNQLRRCDSEYDSEGLYRMLETDVRTPQNASNPIFSPLGMDGSQFSFEGYEGEAEGEGGGNDEIGVARTCWDSVMEFEHYPSFSSSNRNNENGSSGGRTHQQRSDDAVGVTSPRSTGGSPDSKGHSDDLSHTGRELQERARAEARSSRGERCDYEHLERLYGREMGRGLTPLASEERKVRAKEDDEEEVAPLSTSIKGADERDGKWETREGESPTLGRTVAATVTSSAPPKSLPGLLQEGLPTLPGLGADLSLNHASTADTPHASVSAHNNQKQQQQIQPQPSPSSSPPTHHDTTALASALLPFSLPLAPLPLNILPTTSNKKHSRFHRQSQSFSQFQTHIQAQSQAQVQTQTTPRTQLKIEPQPHTQTWTHTRHPHALSASSSVIASAFSSSARDSANAFPLPNYHFHQFHNHNHSHRPPSFPLPSSWNSIESGGTGNNASHSAIQSSNSDTRNTRNAARASMISDTGAVGAGSAVGTRADPISASAAADEPYRALSSAPTPAPTDSGRASSFDPRVVGLRIGMLGRELGLELGL